MSDAIGAASAVLERLLGDRIEQIDLELLSPEANGDSYQFEAKGGQLSVSGSSPVALCRGVYDYLKTYCNSIVTWSGSRLDIPSRFPDAPLTKGYTPYRLRYYFNVVTYAYTLPYWDWERWEKEIDWMALHGLNFPLAMVGTESIWKRVWSELGITPEELDNYFPGPTYMPFHRMGNLIKHDGPPPENWFEGQIELQHKILKRMRELGIEPIVPGFAGFVPPAFKRIYPDVPLRQAGWDGGIESPMLLSPDSPYFAIIGKMYIDEWRNEFGDAKYFLADTFNEMEVPLSDDPDKARDELANYGLQVCKSVTEAGGDLIWTMQGWLFYYGRHFWTEERVQTFLSRVPNDKMLILDLANEYPMWKGITSLWEKFDGFMGKQWVYSVIPNMGGKTCFTGVLDFYANDPIRTLQSPDKGNLVGYGTAPEGLENNDLIYELVTDVAWKQEAVDLGQWLSDYCLSRYGSCPADIKTAYNLLRETVWGSFTDHPRFEFQFRPPVEDRTTVNCDRRGMEAVELFLNCAGELGDNELYRADAYEMAAHYIGCKTTEMLKYVAELDAEGAIKERNAVVQEVIDLLLRLDSILAHHPTHRLDKWVEFARNWGRNKEEKDYYESNCRRIITRWGGEIDDYAARVWSGLIADYYVPRWRMYYLEGKSVDEIMAWEMQWIKTPYQWNPKKVEDPLAEAKKLVEDARKWKKPRSTDQ